MSLITTLEQAQSGSFFASAGEVAGVPEDAARQAVAVLGPAIAEKLKARALSEPDTYEQLLDLIEEGETADGPADAAAMTGPEAIADGNAILTEIYGSRNAAIAEARRLAGELPETALGPLAAITATAVLWVVSQTGRSMPLAAAQPAAGTGSGILGTIVEALVKGALQGARRQLAPRRRRRTRRSYSSYFGTRSRRKTTRRRTARRRTISLDDIFRDILTGSIK